MYESGMARSIPADRFQHLVDCAARVFIDRGYARTQMADVAEAMGVAKGTLYLYVESKEALFDLVVRSLDAAEPVEVPARLPHPTPKPGATLRWVRDRLARQSPSPALASALDRTKVADPRAELGEIIRELHRTIGRNRRGIKLMERSAQFHPKLAAAWFSGARVALVETLARYLAKRIEGGLLRPVPDTTVAARMMLETIVTWSVHAHWDPSPQALDDAVVENTLIQFLTGGLVKEVPE